MKGTRPSALAGTWYSADPAELGSSVDRHLAKGKPLTEVARRPPVAIITPHAGHQWSGDAAGHLFRLLEGQPGRQLQRIILIGPSHHRSFQGGSIPEVASYETPLGTIPLDTEVARALLEQPLFRSVTDAHFQEHCLEIELPFLQRVLKHSFRIVPILISRLRTSDWKNMAGALVPFVDENTLLVVSSDFTHYGDRFGYVPFRDDPDLNLRRLDMGALVPILALDPEGLARYKEETDISVCGWQPIGILLELLGNRDLWNLWGGRRPEGRVLDYYRSADLIGDFNGSVSYASVAFFRAGDLLDGPTYPPRLQGITPMGSKQEPAGEAPDKETRGEGPAMQLNAAERRFLLELARRTLRERVEQNRTPRVEEFPPGVSPEKMREIWGVFVTLTRHGRLRGCIGSIVGRDPLVDGVIDNAINAALKDPRFPPVKTGELEELRIEISVLTPLREVASPGEIEIGRHGVLLEKEGRRAVFLPQVAPEQGWDRDTMLDHLSVKAGLPREGWRKGATFRVFEALVFSEEEEK